MTEYILIYDIPREKKVLQVTINRALKKMKAEKFQHSIWASENLTELKKIATVIKQNGGIANILEKKIVF
jgi:CRISPR/Cas system-associated endoribonuclease Cas2